MRVTFPIIKLLFKIFLNLGGEPRGLIAKLFFLLCPLFILKSAHTFRLNCSFIGFWRNRRVDPLEIIDQPARTLPKTI